MNMNPLTTNIKDKDKTKQEMMKAIQKEALQIAGKVVMGKLTTQDIEKYEEMNIDYHNKYPVKDINGLKTKIAKLKTFIKK